MGFTKELKNDRTEHDLVYEALRTLIHRKSSDSTTTRPQLTEEAPEGTLTPQTTRYVVFIPMRFAAETDSFAEASSSRNQQSKPTT